MTTTPFATVKREDLTPVCPHCDRELAEVCTKGRGVPFIEGRTQVYFCPHCHKVLGFAQGRMI